MGLYAEGFNGLVTGIVHKPINSPYVYAGTSAYSQESMLQMATLVLQLLDQQVEVIPFWDPLMEHKVKQT